VGVYYFVQATAAYTVSDQTYARLEAYIDYARSTWVVRDAGCGTVLGQGVSFKPIGVYFMVRDGSDTAIDGTSAVALVPDCAGGQCGDPPAPPDSPPLDDAGTGDAGAGDAGAGDAGGA
jgi:hypothetical protein